jgi:DNA-binding LacI/PurR family transcriptional regulator
MIDVARAAGVSRTTASFVLNGRDASIPPETRERVRLAAERMGYRPHDGALALATGTTHRIGILLNEPDSFNAADPYFINTLRGVTVGALRHDYNLLLYSAHYPDYRSLCDGLLSGAADGVLLIGRYSDDRLTPALLDSGLPCVCVSFHIDHPRCYSVDCDNEAGSRMAVEHLLQLGHRQIIICHPGDDVSWGRERLSGAQQAMRSAGLPAKNLRTFPWSETHAPSFEWVKQVAEFVRTAMPRPTAIFCCDEWRAQKLCEYLPKIGLRVPGDVAMISYNSTEASVRSHPPISSVWQPLADIGEAAVGMLVRLIAGLSLEQHIQRFPVRLDVRESSRFCEASQDTFVAIQSQPTESEEREVGS